MQKLQIIGNITDKPSPHKILLTENVVEAGFPSPADDYLGKVIDLNEHLISNPIATFLVRVKGESMIDAHIYENDVLIVDRSIRPSSGNIIIGILNGEFTVKRLYKKGEKILLTPENKKLPPIPISEQDEFKVWGVVTYIIHRAY